LRNRFDIDELNSTWCFWFKCLWCDKSGFDAFHHIMSPSSLRYQDGEFNRSMLNSCPIHNFSCHLYNPELHKEENERYLLQKVLRILIKESYILKKIDVEFFKKYESLYTTK